MKKFIITFNIVWILLGSGFDSNAQYFRFTLDNAGNELIVKIAANPGGGDISLSLTNFEVFIRKADDQPAFTFGTITPNLTDFPTISTLAYLGPNVGTESENLFTEHHFGWSLGAAASTPILYNEGQEYEVFRVQVNGDPGEMADFQLAANPTSYNTYVAVLSNSVELTDEAGNDYFYGTTGTNASSTGGTTYFESQANVSLPIDLTEFGVTRLGKTKALLNWTTATEQNASHYEIQRSQESTQWRTIGSVNAQGNSSEELNYNFTDVEASHYANDDQEVYYRLKMLDLDGSHEYSEMRKIAFEKRSFNSKIFPNPARGGEDVTLSFLSPIEGRSTIYIANALGQIVKSIELTGELGEELNINFRLDESLPSGSYNILYGQERELMQTLTLIR